MMTCGQQATLLIQPTDIDILCGRGKAYANHPGNQKFSETIQSNLKKYSDAPRRTDRSLLLASLVENFLNRGSRFLKKDKATSNWVVLDADQCYEKVGHALRDLIRKTRRQNNLQNSSRMAMATIKKHQEHKLHEQEQRHRQQQHQSRLLERKLNAIMALRLNPVFDVAPNRYAHDDFKLLRFVLGR